MDPVSFLVLGSGWRTQFFLKIAKYYPNLFQIASVVARTQEKGRLIEKEWGVQTYRTFEEALGKSEPNCVITSAPWEANPVVTMKAVEVGLPVLSETPPAPDTPSLINLYQKVRDAHGRVQVAEQYHLRPHHQAQIHLVKKGVVGQPTQAQVSAGHDYHGISLVRRLLGVQFESCEVVGLSYQSPMVKGPDRNGPPQQEQLINSHQDFYWLDFGDKLGFIDFTGEQYFAWVRGERVLVRGTHGELANDRVSYLKSYDNPIALSLRRHQYGVEGDINGSYLLGIQCGEEWVYQNPFRPYHLTDEELAVAHCMSKMREYIQSGKEFYSLAEASQDHYLAQVAKESQRQGGVKLTAEPQVWAE